MPDPIVDEGKDVVGEVQLDKDGKHPETVPWDKYVGTKESLGKKLDSEREKVKGLEEQLKKAPNPDEHKRIQGELDDTKNKLTTASDELNNLKNQSISSKKAELVKRGVPEDKLKDTTDKELNLLLETIVGGGKPKPDLGGGGGSGELKGSPMELAQRAYSESRKK